MFPLVKLTKSGAALIETITRGITRTATAPAEALKAFGFMGDLAGRIAIPPALAGTLGLTPVVAGDLPAVAGPVGGTETMAVEPALGVHPAPNQTRLLGETRGALSPGAAGAVQKHRPGVLPLFSILKLLIQSLQHYLQHLTTQPIKNFASFGGYSFLLDVTLPGEKNQPVG